MGTSLTGLTPATTYDALIKVGDNGPLSATAKVLSDGLGNDSPLAMSTTNVGIGTSTPESKLHVADSVSGGIVSVFVDNNINALNSTAQIKFTVDAGGSLTTGGAAIQAVNVDPNYANTDLVFRNTGITVGNLFESMRITNAGNVGIGTSSPAEKLTVNGAVGFQQSGTQTYHINPSSNVLTFVRSGIADVMSVTANGLCFGTDTAAANALDDYEEGTWTIGIEFGGASAGVTYNLNTGAYTKVGNKVTVTGFLQLSSKGSSTGTAKITGLPFTLPANLNRLSAPSLWFNNITFANQFQGYCDQNSTNIDLYETTEAGVATALTNADFANNSEIMLSATYFV